MSNPSKKPRIESSEDKIITDDIHSVAFDTSYENKSKNTKNENFRLDIDAILKADFFLNAENNYFPLIEVAKSKSHTILFGQDSDDEKIDEDQWNDDFVKLPCSKSNKDNENNPKWTNINQTLANLNDRVKQFADSIFLEKAIEKCSSNKNLKLKNLKYLFNKAYSKTESEDIIKNLIPKMIDLALDLPNKIKSSIPILKQGKCIESKIFVSFIFLGNTHSISLTEEQCAIILANAFFCTFPERSYDSNPEDMPFINFESLYTGSNKSKIEKLKCILNYFKRITERASTSKRIITFTRICHETQNTNIFKESNKKVRKAIILLDGKIEDCKGALQLDFANEYIGGGVLNHGCVQEEIRFVLCPELIVSLLFMERMQDNECIYIRGCERFNDYSGYASSFEWKGDFFDTTERDKDNRILTDVLAIDALCFRNSKDQFNKKKIDREIQKCLAGFSAYLKNDKEKDVVKIPCIATGNWGCGAFNGNIELKFLIQLIAATEAGRDLVYFTFNDIDVFSKLNLIMDLLGKNSLTIGQVYTILLEYCDEIDNLSRTQIEEFSLIEFFKLKYSDMN
ncbi:unnamed protein product [Brachionus calyciflorus]|uniref:poly(ADP-ribose) glycohydrolase n=1 Tax=Brachionus calyciflorus TaxID=104777 RepID=A0A813V5E4_9BILA|nr:unnamed protein product [Brachionus calyciflorus]